MTHKPVVLIPFGEKDSFKNQMKAMGSIPFPDRPQEYDCSKHHLSYDSLI